MKSLAEVPVEEFEKALNGQRLRTMQIIQFALAMGVVLFSMVVGILYVVTEVEKPNEPGTVAIFSAVHGLMAVSCCVCAMLVPGMLFRESRLESLAEPIARSTPPDSFAAVARAADACAGLIQTALIVRLALLEGVSFFGLVVCMLATTSGEMREQPIYWLNAVTAMLFVMYAALTFPTKRRVINVFVTKIRKDPFSAYSTT